MRKVFVLAAALVYALAFAPSAARAADLSVPWSVKAAPVTASSWFWVWGLEAGGTVARRDFNLDAGDVAIDIAGARVGGIFGPEYKNAFFMARLLGEVEYNAARGGASCMTTAGMTRCDIASGLVITERVDIGIPLGFLGGLTPFVSAGAQQDQTAASVGAATGRQFENAFLIGGGVSMPLGASGLSLLARYDRVAPAQAIAVGLPASVLLPAIAAVVGPVHDDVVKVGLMGKF